MALGADAGVVQLSDVRMGQSGKDVAFSNESLIKSSREVRN
jgi:hypothetical protein